MTPPPNKSVPSGKDPGERNLFVALQNRRRTIMVMMAIVGLLQVVSVVLPPLLSQWLVWERSHGAAWLYHWLYVPLTTAGYTLPQLLTLHVAIAATCRQPRRSTMRTILVAMPLFIALQLAVALAPWAVGLADDFDYLNSFAKKLMWYLVTTCLYLVLLGGMGPVVQFAWIDLLRPHTGWSPVKRWSTRGLMLTTGTAAAFFAMLRYYFAQAPGNIPEVSGAVSFVWPPSWLMTSLAVGDLLVQFIAALMVILALTKRSWTMWSTWLLVAIATLALSSQATDFVFRTWTASTNPAGTISMLFGDGFRWQEATITVGLHAWLFGFWRRADYQLALWYRGRDTVFVVGE